jgi:hypothetical protein
MLTRHIFFPFLVSKLLNAKICFKFLFYVICLNYFCLQVLKDDPVF